VLRADGGSGGSRERAVVGVPVRFVQADLWYKTAPNKASAARA
jgi:hypothetical protein